MIEVNSIQVPDEFVTLAQGWYDGMSDPLYAISSTGNLTLGTNRPYNDEENRPCTDLEWYTQLYTDLACTLRRLVDILKPNSMDYDELCRFRDWAEEQEAMLDEALNHTP